MPAQFERYALLLLLKYIFIFSEVLFVEMKPEQGDYEPLIGYIILEQSQAGVDMLGHRLIPIKYMDLK